jgi:hypothetical protein
MRQYRGAQQQVPAEACDSNRHRNLWYRYERGSCSALQALAGVRVHFAGGTSVARLESTSNPVSGITIDVA